MIKSLSGAHPFRPQCLAQLFSAETTTSAAFHEDRLAYIVEMIDAGRCPRCAGPLPKVGDDPVGSRVPPCRCVPICGACGSDEAQASYHPLDWPVEYDEMFARNERLMNGSATAVWSKDARGDPVLLVEDGVVPVKMRTHPGGWAEFSYDESADVEELSD